MTFADGGGLATDAAVLATGMGASPFAVQVPGARDELGRVIVDASLRVSAAPEVFIAGNAAAADTGDGHRALQSCQHASQLGLAPARYTQSRCVTCLDLGRSDAV